MPAVEAFLHAHDGGIIKQEITKHVLLPALHTEEVAKLKGIQTQLTAKLHYLLIVLLLRLAHIAVHLADEIDVSHTDELLVTLEGLNHVAHNHSRTMRLVEVPHKLIVLLEVSHGIICLICRFLSLYIVHEVLVSTGKI